MPKGWKIPLYLFLFGALTVYTVFFRQPGQREFSREEVLGTKTDINLLVEPDDGRQSLLDVLNLAQREILVEDYLLSDPDIELYLAEAKKRGIDVQVILEPHPFGGGNLNPKAKDYLEINNVKVVWANPSFTLTHEKTIIVDGRIVCILTLNLTKTAFTKNREYGACDQNPQDVSEARNIFLADWGRKGFSPTFSNLVISPDNSRGKITALIKSATKSIDVEMEVLEDSRMINLLVQVAAKLPVRIILPPLSKVDANQVATNKLKPKTLSSPYVHAKLIIVDSQRVYLGSVNLSSQSLDQNRELGILISQSDVVARINETFQKDWEMAQ